VPDIGDSGRFAALNVEEYERSGNGAGEPAAPPAPFELSPPSSGAGEPTPRLEPAAEPMPAPPSPPPPSFEPEPRFESRPVEPSAPEPSAPQERPPGAG
jgi:hypothetical protein